MTELFEFWNRKRDWSICVEIWGSSWRDNWSPLQWCNGITRSVLCCLSLSNVCSVIMHSDYTLSWTKCKLFDAGWLGQIVRFWYEFDHHTVSLNCSQLTPFVVRWAFIFINFLTVSYALFAFSVTLTENLWTFFSRKSQTFNSFQNYNQTLMSHEIKP